MRAAIISLTFLMAACAHEPPFEEYTLARAALAAARKAGANRLSPSYFHSAEEAYKMGEISFDKQDFDEAHEHFTKSRGFAERAENSARKEKSRSGEFEP